MPHGEREEQLNAILQHHQRWPVWLGLPAMLQHQHGNVCTGSHITCHAAVPAAEKQPQWQSPDHCASQLGTW